MIRPHLGLALILLAVPAAQALPESGHAVAADSDVTALVEQIFDGDLSAEHGNVVLEDTARHLFWAFHIANYLDVPELRVYRIPYASAKPAEVRALLAAGDSDGAFERLLADMNITYGARFLADVGLDGIRDEAVPVGQGQMHDNFHRGQFSDYEAANTAYMQWLQRAVVLKNRAS